MLLGRGGLGQPARVMMARSGFFPRRAAVMQAFMAWGQRG